MTSTRTRKCAHCGKQFTVPRKPGPAPKYCSQAHRQQAYEARRGNSRPDRLAELNAENEALRRQVRILQYDKERLHEELARTEADLKRLYDELEPRTPTPAGLTEQADHRETPPSETPGRKRRWARDPQT